MVLWYYFAFLLYFSSMKSIAQSNIVYFGGKKTILNSVCCLILFLSINWIRLRRKLHVFIKWYHESHSLSHITKKKTIIFYGNHAQFNDNIEIIKMKKKKQILKNDFENGFCGRNIVYFESLSRFWMLIEFGLIRHSYEK